MMSTTQQQISHLVSLLLEPSKAQEALVGLAEFVDDERQRGHIRRYELECEKCIVL